MGTYYISGCVSNEYPQRITFPFLSCNIRSAAAYGVYVSQLIRYFKVCSDNQCLIERGCMLTTRLLTQGYQKTIGGSWPFQCLQCGCFQTYIWCFRKSQAINRLSKSRTLIHVFPNSLFWLIDIVGKARLPSNAYFPWMPDCTPFIWVHHENIPI